MTRLDTVIALYPTLERAELVSWIERHWVVPDGDEIAGWEFHEIDVARVRLIYDLRRDLDVPEENIPLVLSLLDQIYELRTRLKLVSGAIQRQPASVQEAIRALLSDTSG
jgi:chaperone modulatory protein CbpM